MSDLYYDIELLRQMVVKLFPRNRVVLFPQTMFFSNTLGGKYLRQQAIKIYSKHHNLIITARERWSYDSMKVLFPESKLVPDIVMTLDKREPVSNRFGVTLCLRNDIESGLSLRFKELMRSEITRNSDIMDYDTHIGRSCLSLNERENELYKIWSQFRSSEWVITDRLHGMIFAFITGTPCIVLPNNNYKVEGCYSWLKDCGYIFFLDDENIDQLSSLLQKKVRTDGFESTYRNIKARSEEISMSIGKKN